MEIAKPACHSCAAGRSLAMTMVEGVRNDNRGRVRNDTGSGSGLSQGEEDLVSHEDKHSQDDSKTDKSEFASEVIRYNC